MNKIARHRIFSHFPNIAYNVIGIAASQGGLKAIGTILAALPSDFPAAIVIVQHLSPIFPSYMSYILSQRTALRVKQAEDGDLLSQGTVYTPVPDRHTIINFQGTLSLSNSDKINFVRPAADMLFRSLATSYRSRAIAIVLTGRDGDGALGVLAIKKQGGITIAQDETTSDCFSMPKNAIKTKKIDYVLPLEAIAPLLTNLVMPQLATPTQRHRDSRDCL